MRVCPRCGAQYSDDYRFCGYDGSPLEVKRDTDPFLGHVIDGRYRLQSLIGRGAFGLVYVARHERLPRNVAVKVLSRRHWEDPKWLARFEREVRTEAVLNHPNIVDVIDFGTDSQVGYYIVMEYLEGEDLADRLARQGALPILDIYRILNQAGGALSAAHEAGIIHRDIKPANVFLTTEPAARCGYTVRLLDFGIAKVQSGAAELSVGHRDQKTQDWEVIGTPYGMSPEQIRGMMIDARTDIYGLGILLFDMLTGAIPFAADTVEELFHRHLTMPPPKPSSMPGADWILPELDQLVVSMLAKLPADRPQSLRDVLDEFERIEQPLETAWAARHLVSDEVREGRARRCADRVQTDSSLNLNHRRPMVLIVDDERVIRGLVRRIVQHNGYDTAVADTGERALEWLRENPTPDAVILDLLMPGVDGITVLKTLRSNGFEGPVVVCSGVTAESVVEEAKRHGDVEFVDKARELHRIPELLVQLGTPGASDAPQPAE